MAYLNDRKNVTPANSYNSMRNNIILSKGYSNTRYIKSASSFSSNKLYLKYKHNNSAIDSTYKYVGIPQDCYSSDAVSFGNSLRSYSDNQLVHYNDYATTYYYASYTIRNDRNGNIGSFNFTITTSGNNGYSSSSTSTYSPSTSDVYVILRARKFIANAQLDNYVYTITTGLLLSQLTSSKFSTLFSSAGLGTLNECRFDVCGLSWMAINTNNVCYFVWIEDLDIRMNTTKLNYYACINIDVKQIDGQIYNMSVYISGANNNTSSESNKVHQYLRVYNTVSNNALHGVNALNYHSSVTNYYAKLNIA